VRNRPKNRLIAFSEFEVSTALWFRGNQRTGQTDGQTECNA